MAMMNWNGQGNNPGIERKLNILCWGNRRWQEVGRDGNDWTEVELPNGMKATGGRNGING
jgi:hypothetical protein